MYFTPEMLLWENSGILRKKYLLFIYFFSPHITGFIFYLRTNEKIRDFCHSDCIVMLHSSMGELPFEVIIIGIFISACVLFEFCTSAAIIIYNITLLKICIGVTYISIF